MVTGVSFAAAASQTKKAVTDHTQVLVLSSKKKKDRNYMEKLPTLAV